MNIEDAIKDIVQDEIEGLDIDEAVDSSIERAFNETGVLDDVRDLKEDFENFKSDMGRDVSSNEVRLDGFEDRLNKIEELLNVIKSRVM
jgi:hypothetical protein